MPVWTEDDGSTTNYLDKQVDLDAGTIYRIRNSSSTDLFTITESTGTVSALSGVTGNVTGNLTGNVTGNLTGNVTGNLTGNVTGNLTGNSAGVHTGNVTGDVTGDLIGNMTPSNGSSLSGTSANYWLIKGNSSSVENFGFFIQTQDDGTDSYISFLEGNIVKWSIGNDGSDSDAFKISANHPSFPSSTPALETDTKLTLDTTGNLTTAGDVNGASPAEMGYLSGVTSSIQTQIGSKQDTLTFGIALNSPVKCEEACAEDDFAIFGPDGLKGLTATEAKIDLSLNNVENTAISTWAGSANITTLGTIGTGTWQGTAIGDTYISSAATWNGKQAALTFGIANTNSLKVDEETTATSGEIARFTGTGIQSVSDATIKTQLSLNNVTNHAQLPLSGGTMAGNVDFGDNDITNVDSLDADKLSIAGGTEMTAVLDEDNMATNSATALATQQSIKAYVDANAGGGGSSSTYIWTKNVAFNYGYAAGNTVWIPMSGNIYESTSNIQRTEYQVIVMPFDGYLDKVIVRSNSIGGSSPMGFHLSSTGTQMPNSTATTTVTLDLAAVNTPYTYTFGDSGATNAATFSKGQVFGLTLDPTNDINDCAVTMVFVMDSST